MGTGKACFNGESRENKCNYSIPKLVGRIDKTYILQRQIEEIEIVIIVGVLNTQLGVAEIEEQEVELEKEGDWNMEIGIIDSKE